jgi:ribosome-associated protein
MMQDEYSQELAGDEIEIEAIGVEVSSQPIELYKVLKIANVVSGGGEAKYAIAEGYVAVNGELETRKRCKIYDGDLIEFNGEYYLVICDQPVEEVIEQPVVQPVVAKPKSLSKKQHPAKSKSHKPSEKQKNKPAKAKNSAKSNKKGASIEASTDGGRSRIHFA